MMDPERRRGQVEMVEEELPGRCPARGLGDKPGQCGTEKGENGGWGWGHGTELGFYSGCDRRPLQGFSATRDVM